MNDTGIDVDTSGVAITIDTFEVSFVAVFLESAYQPERIYFEGVTPTLTASARRRLM